MNYEDNIRAILQTVFSETKGSNIDVAVDNILNLKCEDAPVKKDDTPKYYLRIMLKKYENDLVILEATGISEVHVYNIIKMYNSVLCSLEITIREVDSCPEQTGKK